jgi:hypothetical protein
MLVILFQWLNCDTSCASCEHPMTESGRLRCTFGAVRLGPSTPDVTHYRLLFSKNASTTSCAFADADLLPLPEQDLGHEPQRQGRFQKHDQVRPPEGRIRHDYRNALVTGSVAGTPPGDLGYAATPTTDRNSGSGVGIADLAGSAISLFVNYAPRLRSWRIRSSAPLLPAGC